MWNSQVRNSREFASSSLHSQAGCRGFEPCRPLFGYFTLISGASTALPPSGLPESAPASHRMRPEIEAVREKMIDVGLRRMKLTCESGGSNGSDWGIENDPGGRFYMGCKRYGAWPVDRIRAFAGSIGVVDWVVVRVESPAPWVTEMKMKTVRG